MKFKLLAIAVIVAVALSATLVIAAGPRAGRPDGGPAVCPQGPGQCAMGCVIGPGIAKELGLTEDQIGQLKQLCSECCTQTQATRELLKTKMKDLVPLMTAQTLNPDAIRAALAEIEVLKAELRDVCQGKIIAGLSVLTGEQRAKLGELIKNRPGLGLGMGCGMGCGMGTGPGCGAGMGPGCGMGAGRGLGPGAGRGCCPLGGAGNPNCPLGK